MALEDVKKLRDMTSLGIKDCKQALDKAGGDFDKAFAFLKDTGVALMAKRGGREVSQGVIDCYVHFGGNLGAMVEVNCETDFVARTEVFKKFVKDIAMQVAAARPEYLSKEDIPESSLATLENKEEFIKQACLMEQSFIKDSKITVADCLRDVISKIGENVKIRRFTRYALGEGD